MVRCYPKHTNADAANTQHHGRELARLRLLVTAFSIAPPHTSSLHADAVQEYLAAGLQAARSNRKEPSSIPSAL